MRRLLRCQAFECEPDFQQHLVMTHFSVFDLSACLDHLEPAKMLERLRCPGDGALDRILDARLRRAHEIDDLVDVVLHSLPFLRSRGSTSWRSGIPRFHL